MVIGDSGIVALPFSSHRSPFTNLTMPKPSTVTEPAELLAYLFATWTGEKKKQIAAQDKESKAAEKAAKKGQE